MSVNPTNSESTETIINRINNNISSLYTLLNMYILLYDETVKPNIDISASLKLKLKEKMDRIL